MKLLLFFIDGLGLGEDNKEINPLKNACLPNINRIFSENRVVPTDATLGMPGLPQSATGQTAILTGINASKALGRHVNGMPNRELRYMLNEHSLLKRLKNVGCSVSNANMYTTEYNQLLEDKNKRFKPSATTVATLAAGIPFKREEDMLKGNAVYQDITNEILIKRGMNVPIKTSEQAAHSLLKVMQQNDFTLFEYFQTDVAGHSMNMDRCIHILETIDGFLGEVYGNIDKSEFNIIITSDHGNIEDLSVKTHTMNHVPTILIGTALNRYSSHIKTIEHITPVILDFFQQ